MGLPNQPVTLSPEQLHELDQRLAKMRHDVNGFLTLIIAANELIKLKPESAARWAETLAEQPMRIRDAVAQFSTDFDTCFGITRAR